MPEAPDEGVRRCPLNVAGPFYTGGDCLFCHLPEDEAPELLAPLDDSNSITYFVKQPVTPDEVERACRAIESCCVDDLRYGGDDPAVIMRLGNSARYCDNIVHDGQVVPEKNRDSRP